MTRITVIDNYDSFTYNVVHGLAHAGADVSVHRNDAIDRDRLAADRPDGIVLSPGPGHPGVARDFGVCTDLVKRPLDVPMMGICLGMQGMALHTGGAVDRAPEVVHGETRRFKPHHHVIFDGLPDEIQVGRYHSLCVAAAPPDAWHDLGRTDDGVLMAMAHRQRPWIGLQFHPESILTPDGQTMIDHFVQMCT